MRRTTLLSAAVAVLLGTAAGGCAGGRPSQPSEPTTDAMDFSARFAAYEPAPEPNGDLSKVSWPDYVLRASPEVKRLYEFQVTHGELMRYMPCYCGCGQNAGHRNNRDCYIRRVNADGSVVFDSMAPT
jgi:hypothetical protein